MENPMVVCVICGYVYDKNIGHTCLNNYQVGTYVVPATASKPMDVTELLAKKDEEIVALRARAERDEADAAQLAKALGDCVRFIELIEIGQVPQDVYAALAGHADKLPMVDILASDAVPKGEVHFVSGGKIVGKITGLDQKDGEG